MKEILIKLFQRDLIKLKEELIAYREDQNLWKIEKDIKNSGGNLTLHLLGNLNHFVGAILGDSGYHRNRDGEFTNKNIPRDELVSQIEEASIMIAETLEHLPQKRYSEIYPEKVLNQSMTVEFMLFHLTTHLAYHLGQINYHRRLIDA